MYSKEERKKQSIFHKKLWQDPNSAYNSKEWKRKQRISHEKYIKQLPKSAYKLFPNLAYILGVMLGDGYMEKTRIKLLVKDKDFALNFKQKLEKWSGLKAKLYRRDNPSFSQGFGYITEFHSVKAVEIVEDYKNHISKVMLNAPRKCQIAFLEGLYDSEGHIPNTIQNRSIYFYNSSKKLINLVYLLLKLFEITSQIYLHREANHQDNHLLHKKAIYTLQICNFKNIPPFCKLIHFSIKRKQEYLEKISNYIYKN